MISIMMPAYNAEQWIQDAIDSCINQTIEDWELIIIDDGSTDNTWKIIERQVDSRIKSLQIKHSGCAQTRNMCLANCTGEIIARLDADDWQRADRLEKQIKFLSQAPITTCKMFQDDKPFKQLGAMDAKTYWQGEIRGPVNASIVAYSYVYRIVGGFNPYMKGGSDGDWNFRALLMGMTYSFVDEYLYHQRRHTKQLSTTQSQSNQKRNHKLACETYKGMLNALGVST